MNTQKRLPKDSEIIGYHNLHIIVSGKGGVAFIVSPAFRDFNKGDAYKKSAWRKTYVSDGGRVVVYATSHEKRVFNDDVIVGLLRDWKAGLWVHTDMRRKGSAKGGVK